MDGTSESLISRLKDDVAIPFANGTGLLQLYNNFTNNPIHLKSSNDGHDTFVDEASKTVFGLAGTMASYVAAGRLASFGMKALSTPVSGGLQLAGAGEGWSLGAATFLNSERAANILGAGVFEGSKVPTDGANSLSHRLALAGGTMAGFGVFEAGNAKVASLTEDIGNKWMRGAAATAMRLPVGAAGGLATYGTTFGTGWALGDKTNWSTDAAIHSAVSSALFNGVLPPAQHGAMWLVDKGINQPLGRGTPIARHLQYTDLKDAEVKALAAQFPQTRVKISDTPDAKGSADVKRPTVQIGRADAKDASVLAHEMEHLRLAKLLAPHYKSIGDQLARNPGEQRVNELEQQFYSLREYAEREARKTGERVRQRATGTAADTTQNETPIRDQIASNGRTYGENWAAEWQALKADPNYQPRFEYQEQEAKPTNQAIPRETQPGSAENLGATLVRDGGKIKGVNFAVHSTADGVDLLLFDSPEATTPKEVIPLTRDENGSIFHRFLPGSGPGMLYGIRVSNGEWDPAEGKWFNPNKMLVDPWAKAVTGDTNRPRAFDDSDKNDPMRYLHASTTDNIADIPKAVVVDDDAFDWQGVKAPKIDKRDTIAAEINVRALTALDTSIPEHLRGTYLGVVAKIPYLQRLGVNAVKIMPTDAFDTAEDGKTNDWGYQPWNFFAPKASLSSNKLPGASVDEFKTMVRELNRAGISVISDEVYNHTSEGGTFGPTISFRGLDNLGYYMVNGDHKSQYVDYTGVGNTLNPGTPIVQRMVLDSLRYKAQHLRVNGFRYDLGATFLYDPNEIVLKAMQNDPVLSSKLHIIEPWNIARWDEGKFGPGLWNESGTARDTMRNAVKSDSGMMSKLASMIMGLPEKYGKGQNKPESFITSHDGFTLNDLWSYQQKHNEANLEENRDGESNNHNWNGGREGPTDDPQVNELRRRLSLNSYLLNLMPVNGSIVMLQLGDEFGHSKFGNNNTYCQPLLNNLDWQQAKAKDDDVWRASRLVTLRDEHKLGRADIDNVTFYGTDGKPHERTDVQHWRQPTDAEKTQQGNDNWIQDTIKNGGLKIEDDARFLAWKVDHTGPNGDKQLFVVSNNYWEPLDFKLPPGHWRLYENTGLTNDQLKNDKLPTVDGGSTYQAGGRTALIFEAVP